MMPPAGTAIGGVTSGHNVPTGVHNWATKFNPALHSTAIDHSQSEVAKTYFPCEFGNGAANGGVSSANLDCSMLDNSGSKDVAYVMDDGLTSLTGEDVRRGGSILQWFTTGVSDFWYMQFIGTGITMGARAGDDSNGPPVTIAQNLHYGTHLVTFYSDGSTHQTTRIYIDGVLVKTTSGNENFEYGGFWNMTFHQPKMPPIPDDACILADYMLMADFVPQSAQNSNDVSKGSRVVNCSRDIFYEASSGSNALYKLQTTTPGGFKVNSNTTAAAGVYYGKVSVFGTNFLWKGYDVGTRGQLKVDGSNATQTTTSGSSWSHIGYITSGSEPVLGLHTFEGTNKASQELMIEQFEIATPIHTSSHYQNFESTYAHELIGGDRNIEQTNLVVTADGKTWDEITRDTSYIGNNVACLTRTGGNLGGSDENIIWDQARGYGAGSSSVSFFNKDSWAISWDRLVCLRDGDYTIHAHLHNAYGTSADMLVYIKKNGVVFSEAWTEIGGANENLAMRSMNISFVRGDYLEVRGRNIAGNNAYRTHVTISKNS